MKKKEYLKQLKSRISQLPESEINENISFYSERINEIINQGYTEEEALEKLGSIDQISDDVFLNTSTFTLIKSFLDRKNKRRTLKGIKIIAIITSPIWIILILLYLFISLALYLLSWLAMISISVIVMVFGYGSISMLLRTIGVITRSLVSAAAYIGIGLILMAFAITSYVFAHKAITVIFGFSQDIRMLMKRVFIIRGGKNGRESHKKRP